MHMDRVLADRSVLVCTARLPGSAGHMTASTNIRLSAMQHTCQERIFARAVFPVPKPYIRRQQGGRPTARSAPKNDNDLPLSHSRNRFPRKQQSWLIGLNIPIPKPFCDLRHREIAAVLWFKDRKKILINYG